MDQRLGRTVRAFLLVLATAGVHRLVVVPLVEPSVRAGDGGLEMSVDDAAALKARADRRLAALEGVFPADAWERKDPIILESRQMRLLFRQYNAVDGGRVHLVPCTLVILPEVVAGAPPGRTLVLRAEQGAVLEFDEPLDLRQGRLARLVGGSLRGPVTIRGTASAPGADDDIEIETRDVELADLEVRTSDAVQFRYGRSTGSGRGLVARLLPRSGPANQGPNIGGVDSIRLERDVRLKLEGLGTPLVPGGVAPGPDAPAASAANDGADAPVSVTCRGALVVNIGANLVTLDDHVDVVRTLPDGDADQLACDQLAILLARDPPAGPAAASKPTRGLTPREIQARGRPVVATSAATALEARGGRLGYEIATRRILLDGDEPVSLVVQGTEMEARSIDYVPGPPGSPGALMAVGPGWLRTRPEGSPPAHVKWQKWLRVRPDGGSHVASLAGAADVTIPTQGRLSAAEMHLWLDATPAAAPVAAKVHPLSGVQPQRMLARGTVEVDAASLAARTDQLQLWFRRVEPPAAPPPAPAAVSVAAPSPASAGPLPAGQGPGAPPVAPVTPARAPRPPAAQVRGRLIAVGALVRGQVVLAGAEAEMEELSMEGQVRLTEEDQSAAAPSMEITGDQLQLTRPLRPEARAIISGRPARIVGRGMDLEGPLVEFDRGANRVTVDGAGRLGLPMERGIGGLESLAVSGHAPAPSPAAPGTLDVRWQGRLDFDGTTARFVDKVRTVSGGTRLDAGVLDVTLTRTIDFGTLAEGAAAAPRADVARIACGNNVRIESESQARDGGRSVEKIFVRDLVIDRASGDVLGTGPGRLTSTRFGQLPAFTPPAPTPGAPPPEAAAPAAPRLTYLGVDFQRGLRGHLQRRTLEFHQRVEAIWGPVAAWEETLDPHAAAGLPPGAVSVSSDALGLGQAPPLPGQTRSALELVAAGNVMVEGESFTARSARLSWSEAKDLLVFEGDGRSDAQLYRQLQVGAPTSSASAGKILFWRSLNRVDVDDARYLDFDQLAPGGGLDRLPGLPAARRPAPPPR
ncbi:MAG: hypothetical protein ACKOCW_03605 [Planctomycetaceae bacterium]